MASPRTNLPAHRRVECPPGLRMTGRDRDVLVAVHRMRALTSHQIEALLFPSHSADTRSLKSACQRRLQKLYHHGYLNRIIQPLILGEGREAFAYVLDARGANELANHLGEDRAEIGWTPKQSRFGPLFLEHLLAVNDVRVVVELLVKRQSWNSVEWRDEQALRVEPYLSGLPYQIRRDRRTYIIPDGYFQVRPGEEGPAAHFFLEVDQGTMSNRRWADKIAAYRQFRDSGHSKQYFGTSNFRVLALASTGRRLGNLLKVTEEVDKRGYYWFAEQAEVNVWQPQRWLDPIWRVAGTEERHRLFQPH